MNIYIEGAHDIIHETSVDFVLRPCSKEVNIVQYDLTLPIVKVNLYKNGERYQLENDVEANVRFGKLDHTFVYKAVLGCNAERNAVYFQVDEQMTLIAGRVSPTIELKWEYNNTTGFANSSPIPVVITRNPIQESDVESSSYAPLFVEVLLQVDDLRERVENMEAVVTHDVVTLYTDQDDITGKKTFKKEIVLGGNVNSRPLLTGILQNGNSSEILTILDVNAVSGTNKGFKLTNIKSISGLITPTTNDQAANKAYVDTKVAKVTSSTTYEQAYTKLPGGAQSMHDISASADNNTIALRTASGTIVVSDPTNPSDAATKRYVDGFISTVYKPQGSATVTQLINLTKTSSMNGYVYNMSNAGTLVDHDGTQMNVLAGDNVVLIWNNGDWYWDKLAGTVDLSPYARKDASNIFSGELNTFNGHVLINGASRYLGVANIINIRKLWYQDQCTTGTCDIEFTQTYIQINKELNNNLIPAVTNTYSIGNSSKQWVDIWFNGSLKDGSGRSLTLEQISAKYTKPLTGIPSSDLEDIHAVGTNLTKCKITYNSKGQVTNGQDLNYADIPALHTIIPTDNDSYDLGSNTKYWQNAYISRSIKFGSTSNSSLDIIYNINTSDTILTINKDYIQANKSLRTASNIAIEANGLLYVGGQEIRFNDHVNFTDNTNEHNNIIQLFNNDIIAWKTATFKSALNVDGLIFAGGHEIRFANDYLDFTDNTDQHNTIVKIHKDYVNFWRQATFLSNVKIADQNDTSNPLMQTTFNDGNGIIFGGSSTENAHWTRFNGAAEFNGLMWAGGKEIRFPEYVNFTDNTNNHNTIVQITPDNVRFNKPLTDGTNSITIAEMVNKVDKVSGKDLSTNDFTTPLKIKLEGIEAMAQVNVIESIKVNETALTVSSKAVNIDVPLNQTQVCIVADSLHNINGYAVSASRLGTFISTDTTITTGGKTYTVKIIKLKVGSIISNLTEQIAKEYMEQMCGSQYVSKYDERLPHDHIFMMADFTLWKPQWDSTNGLVLWKLSEVQSQLYVHHFIIHFTPPGSSTYVAAYVDLIMARSTPIEASEMTQNTGLRDYINSLLCSAVGHDEDDERIWFEGFHGTGAQTKIWISYSGTQFTGYELNAAFSNTVEKIM